MTVDEKMQVLEDMGIEYRQDCPFEYGLQEDCRSDENYCKYCWAKALED